jgi:hypothetical protein
MTARGVVAMSNTSPIVAAALSALSAFNVTHVDVAISFLGCWRRRDELSTDDWTAVLSHYGGPTRMILGYTEGWIAGHDDAMCGAYSSRPGCCRHAASSPPPRRACCTALP